MAIIELKANNVISALAISSLFSAIVVTIALRVRDSYTNYNLSNNGTTDQTEISATTTIKDEVVMFIVTFISYFISYLTIYFVFGVTM